MPDKTPLLELKDIHKKFPGVYALQGVNFDLYPGEVHALLGENGAGKSTLVKILSGIYTKDQGEIVIDGKPVKITNANEALDNGLSVIHQELVLVPHLSIAENLFLGREPLLKNGLVDFQAMSEQTQKFLLEFGLNLHPEAEVASLTIAQQQMVEVVKAISFNARIIAMDEPTSSLTDKEVNSLFSHIRDLAAHGIGIIYISHRMSELFEIADRVTVLRDGKYIGTRNVKETTTDELITMTVGRPISKYYNRTYNTNLEVVLKVKDLCSRKVKNVNFDLRKGEILGFSGLVGAGRSETMHAILGIDRITGGTIEFEGQTVHVKSTEQMIDKGFSMVPEDRKDEGIFPFQTLKFNLTLKTIKEFINFIFVKNAKEDEISNKYMHELSIKAPNSQTIMNSLSGGNQQKVVISSWLATNPKVLILDEPTRGIDVGTKSEIYEIMNELAQKGVSIIMISSDLPEILNLSDRVVVMCEGTTTAVIDHSQATQEKILQYAVKI
jgi:ABC-type sugar transport system ATPase subunit